MITEIIDILVGGLTAIPSAIGQGLNGALSAIFIEAGESGGLSLFAEFALTFGGIALGLSLTYLVFNIIRGKVGA